MYFCASKMGEPCPFYRCQDPLTEPFERVEGSFAFWDPNMFLDDDGRLYLYWGCSNVTPIWGVELNPETMERKGEPVTLVSGDSASRGFRSHRRRPCAAEDPRTGGRRGRGYGAANDAGSRRTMRSNGIGDEDAIRSGRDVVPRNHSYIEGAWMTKHDGKYYLQYATPGTEYNVYGDAVMIADSPLGPFTLALNNPYSYNPGGFMNGAGHGSTMADRHGKWWHTATMSISVNHVMERRLGLWKAGFDSDGELFCDQSYADWPIDSDAPAWSEPDWMLLS
ncbi:MAG: family 43 glycosylhydrolase [Bifidobacterium dentium]